MKAAFFDMDGTLVDSAGDLCATVNHTRRDLGLAELPAAEILRHVGLGARRLLVDSIPEMAHDEERMLEVFMSHYGEHMMETVAPYPGPHISPQSITLRCIGKSIFPISGICPVTKGRTSPIARNIAASTSSFKCFFIFSHFRKGSIRAPLH